MTKRWTAIVFIGHVNLSKRFDSSGTQLLLLTRALSKHGVRQHAVVRCPLLLEGLSDITNVSLGPLADSPVMANCVLPAVDLAHLHDTRSATTGLILSLTRSIPYIITIRGRAVPAHHAIARSIHRRAACVICTTDPMRETMRGYCPDTYVETISDARTVQENASDLYQSPRKMAAAYISIYRRTLNSFQVPDMLI